MVLEQAVMAARIDELEEALGRAADTVDSLIHALGLELSPEIHVEALRGSLPTLLEEMRAALPSED